MQILIADDERVQRDILRDILCDEGYTVLLAEDGVKAINTLQANEVGIVLTDLKMPNKDGLEVLKSALEKKPAPQVIIMTAFGSIPGAVAAIKQGAYDYLSKPFQKEDLLRVISRAAEKYQLLLVNQRLQAEVEERYSYGKLVGKSTAMRRVYDMIERIKDVDATCLISGESGTGKELVARAIHYNGVRKKGPFVAINCGAIPENLIESELFGHKKGAFTGAIADNPGSFLYAHGGTIFLDEIATMRRDLQVKLLRVLQEKAVTPVGGSTPVAFDVRIIAASNADLQEEVQEDRFRMDLYHRLNVFSIHIPPLRERDGDIPRLLSHFLEKFSNRYGKKTPRFEANAILHLEKYNFPGNVRELENIVEKITIMNDKEIIGANDIPLPTREGNSFSPKSPGKDKSLPEMERDVIRNALRDSGGKIKKAADKLGISYKTLQYRIKKFNIDKSSYKNNT